MIPELKPKSAIVLLAFYCAIFITYFYLHEFAGHYLANLILGVPIEQMAVHYNKFIFIPIPYAVQLLQGTPSTFTYFFGGFMSGILLLILSLLFLYLLNKKNQSNYWWLFAITFSFSLIGFTECIFETFFLEYHRGVIELLILAFFAFFILFFGIWRYSDTLTKTLK